VDAVPDHRHDLRLRHITIHGHEVGYRMAGSGPAVVLVHGLAGSSTTWQEVMPALADHFTVLAPDLLGHGDSAKPRGDYSLGAHASGLRDLMVALGIERATFVGHSLGGGVALQLAYQFPERCERLVLVASGGLGKEVNSLLRAVSLPGSELVMPVLLSGQMHSVLDAINRWFGRRASAWGPPAARCGAATPACRRPGAGWRSSTRSGRSSTRWGSA
jgi:pimeloyl-ACP methyl ester carboxylesterase